MTRVFSAAFAIVVDDGIGDASSEALAREVH
jgi:hypothetical protein